MHRKKSGAYVLKPHQLADARHKTLAETLQSTGAAAHVPPALAPGVLVRLASRISHTQRFIVHPVTHQLGLGHGTFVIQDDPPVVCAHHPQHGRLGVCSPLRGSERRQRLSKHATGSG